MVVDKTIAWLRKRQYVGFGNRSLGSVNGTTITAFNTAASGLKIATANTPTEFVIQIPVDVNPEFAMGFRVHWGAIGTPATMGNCNWVILTSFVAATGALLTAGAIALDTVITLVQTPPAANSHTWTSRGIKNGNFLSRVQIFAGAVLHAGVNLAAVSGTIDSTNAAFLFGLEFDYVPMSTEFPHNDTDRPLVDTLV